jgi:hypothetical protein
MVGRELAVTAARNFRLLSARGVSVRSTIDTLIAHSVSRKVTTCCIAIATSTLLSNTWDCA